MKISIFTQLMKKNSFSRQILDHYEKNILLNENFNFHAVNERKFSLLDKVSEKRNKVKDIK